MAAFLVFYFYEKIYILHTLLTMFKKLQAMVVIPKNLPERLKMLSIKNRYALIIYAFILLELSFFIILAVIQENKTQGYLEQKTVEAKRAYETVHHSFNKISEIVASSREKNQEIMALLKEASRVIYGLEWQRKQHINSGHLFRV